MRSHPLPGSRQRASWSVSSASIWFVLESSHRNRSQWIRSPDAPALVAALWRTECWTVGWRLWPAPCRADCRWTSGDRSTLCGFRDCAHENRMNWVCIELRRCVAVGLTIWLFQRCGSCCPHVSGWCCIGIPFLSVVPWFAAFCVQISTISERTRALFNECGFGMVENVNTAICHHVCFCYQSFFFSTMFLTLQYSSDGALILFFV